MLLSGVIFPTANLISTVGTLAQRWILFEQPTVPFIFNFWIIFRKYSEITILFLKFDWIEFYTLFIFVSQYIHSEKTHLMNANEIIWKLLLQADIQLYATQIVLGTDSIYVVIVMFYLKLIHTFRVHHCGTCFLGQPFMYE